MRHNIFLFFFFFQAEDGIRDLTVTGVQTCALPISTNISNFLYGKGFKSPFQTGVMSSSMETSAAMNALGEASMQFNTFAAKIGRASCREKCRSRWSQYH